MPSRLDSTKASARDSRRLEAQGFTKSTHVAVDLRQFWEKYRGKCPVIEDRYAVPPSHEPQENNDPDHPSCGIRRHGWELECDYEKCPFVYWLGAMENAKLGMKNADTV